MTTSTAALARVRPARRAGVTAFVALLVRDVHVLRRQFVMFILRTVMQPLLLVFVFTYVFPKIGQGIGGAGPASAAFSTILVPGVVATAMIFQGIQAVAIPLVQEFSFTREIEDRVMAPLPMWAVALQKVVSGAIQGLLAGLVVFPLAAIIPTTPVHLDAQWPQLAAMAVLASLVGATLGLTIGTRAAPNQIALVFSIIVIPITFLGCTYYPWASLEPIAWLKYAVLVNPLVYMSEGFRLSLTPVIPHMHAAAVFGALIAFIAGLGYLGVKGFRRRVLT